jgi:hypothetical protein
MLSLSSGLKKTPYKLFTLIIIGIPAEFLANISMSDGNKGGIG